MEDTPHQSRAETRRAHLLETARRLFVIQGFHKTGMAQIATASGIKVGQIYRDFQSKEDIIAAICERDVAQWLEEDSLRAAVDAGDLAAVRAWMDRFLLADQSIDDSIMMSEIVAEVSRNPRVAELSRAIDLKVRGSLAVALQAIADQTGGGATCEVLIDFIMAIGIGIPIRRTLDPELQVEPLFRYVSAIIDRQIGAADNLPVHAGDQA